MMPDSSLPLHIVFNVSAAASLRQALKKAGKNEPVAAQFDDLSFGPIDPLDFGQRTRWVEQELHYEDWATVEKQDAEFWNVVLSGERRRIVWLSRRSSKEYTGFLEWLWRSTDQPCQIIDLTETTMVGNGPNGATQPYLIQSLALINPDQILELGLLERVETLSASERGRYKSLWTHLKSENAPLRALNERGLESAPISYFDPLLLSGCAKEWKKTARVIGEALTAFYDDHLLQTGDLFLAARIRTLAEMGLLESQGDLHQIRFSEIRLPMAEI